MTYIDENGEPHQFMGEAKGHIAEEIHDCGNGFGFDPIFFSDDLEKCFGEASSTEKTQSVIEVKQPNSSWISLKRNSDFKFYNIRKKGEAIYDKSLLSFSFLLWKKLCQYKRLCFKK